MGINVNGQGPALPAQGVPIVGQPVELVVADCRFVYFCRNCGKGVIAIPHLGASAKCTNCTLVAHLRGFRSHGNQVTTDLGFGFAQAVEVTDGNGPRADGG